SPSPSWSLCPNSVGDRFEVIRYLRAFDRLLVRPVGSCRGGSARPPRPARQRGGRPAKRPRCFGGPSGSEIPESTTSRLPRAECQTVASHASLWMTLAGLFTKAKRPRQRPTSG